MRKQFATLFTLLIGIQNCWAAFNVDVNLSYDYFRGLPDGSWNGNSGAFVAANVNTSLYECVGVQLGGSFGLYNWDGRENQVFRNSKELQQQIFVTGGVFTPIAPFNLGFVYDRQFVEDFGIYAVDTSFDQLRFQGGYAFCWEEIGIWGTAHLTTAHKSALGLPVSFRAINQINLFWTHYFENLAMSTLWIGTPYGNSLKFHHKPAGTFTAGFSLHAPLTTCLFIDCHASYMRARSSGSNQSRNYASHVCLGLTYVFGGECADYPASYMSLANNSNFLVDTNVNQ